jgi:hypothetical protein
VDERHRNRFCAVAANEKPRSGIVISGIMETGCDLIDTCCPRPPTALTTRQI